MAATRNQMVSLPGKVTIDQAGDDVSLYSSDPISVALMEENVILSTQHEGDYEETPIGRLVQVKMKPTQFTAAALAKLFPHGAVAKGGSILAATDKTLDVHTIDGVRRRIPNAFVYAEPAMLCKTGSTILGEVTWYGLIPLGGDPSVLANFYNKTSVAFDYSSWNPANEKTFGWDFRLSDDEESGWYDVDTQGGVTITPKSSLQEYRSDRDGLKNITITKYGVEVKANCLNISEDMVLAATGWNGMKLGAQKGATLGQDIKLNAVGGGGFIRAYNAVLQQPYNFNFDVNKTVVADLTWATRPSFTAGVLGAHLLVTDTDPDA